VNLRLILKSTLAVVVVLAPRVSRVAPAFGATPGAPAAAAPVSVSQQAKARVHFQQGVALYQEQNFDGALAEFVGAYDLSHEPVVLYNLGLTYKSLFRYGEAVETLQRYLDESGAKGHPTSPERHAEVEKLVAEMRSLLADVTLVVKPADAVLRIDGRLVTLGIEGIVKLPAGSHNVEASAPDFKPSKSEIVVVAGTPQTVSLALVPIVRTGRVKIATAQIGARVSVDGRDVGPGPVEVELLAGGHQVEVTAPGFAPNRTELVIAAGQIREVTMTLEPPSTAADTRPFYHRWWFWTGVGVAVASTATVLLLPERTQGPIPGNLGIANSNQP
jgi:hypothetical protein